MMQAESVCSAVSSYIWRIETFPTEEQQFCSIQAGCRKHGREKVIIRTLDIGADKQIDYFDMAHEENPAMGYRAIRICLDRPEVFKTQLRALFRAVCSEISPLCIL